MPRNNRLTVTIRRVPDESDTYIAMFDSPVLSSTFCVVFPDSVTGALALHEFADMLQMRFGRPVELHQNTDLFPVRSKAMDDVLAAMREYTGHLPAGRRR